MFDIEIWRKLPFHFWTVVAFIFGSMVGSFLNVCIHRMPLGESVVRPPSHCPHCRYSIPWYLNIPLFTWLWLGGRCRHCRAPISPRYFLVELMTGVLFAACQLKFGHISPLLPVAYWILLGGLIAGSFIDLEHMIIPDQITYGGMAAGLFCTLWAPQTHLHFPDFLPLTRVSGALMDSFLGLVIGGGIIYAILRGGKFFWGRQKVDCPPGARITFTETGVKLPDEEIPYEDLFYRKSDAVELQAQRVEMIDRCYCNTSIHLTADCLKIGDDSFVPEQIHCLEVVTDRIVLPREVMGPADVTFMAAIGAFLGWPAVFFSLALSSMLGSVVGGLGIVFKTQEWSSRIPYGPYIAAGALIWIFGGYHWMQVVLRLN